MQLSHFALRALVTLLWVLGPIPAHAAHPLITEDTGTQGQGNFQVELTNEQFSIQEDAGTQKLALTALTLSYGIVDSTDSLRTNALLTGKALRW